MQIRTSFLPLFLVHTFMHTCLPTFLRTKYLRTYIPVNLPTYALSTYVHSVLPTYLRTQLVRALLSAYQHTKCALTYLPTSSSTYTLRKYIRNCVCTPLPSKVPSNMPTYLLIRAFFDQYEPFLYFECCSLGSENIIIQKGGYGEPFNLTLLIQYQSLFS